MRSVFRQHDALHDPRLPAALGQQPARRVDEEGQRRGPYRHPQESPGRREWSCAGSARARTPPAGKPGPRRRPSPAWTSMDENVSARSSRARTCWCTATGEGRGRSPCRSSGWWPASDSRCGNGQDLGRRLVRLPPPIWISENEQVWQVVHCASAAAIFIGWYLASITPSSSPTSMVNRIAGTRTTRASRADRVNTC